MVKHIGRRSYLCLLLSLVNSLFFLFFPLVLLNLLHGLLLRREKNRITGSHGSDLFFLYLFILVYSSCLSFSFFRLLSLSLDVAE